MMKKNYTWRSDLNRTRILNEKQFVSDLRKVLGEPDRII